MKQDQKKLLRECIEAFPCLRWQKNNKEHFDVFFVSTHKIERQLFEKDPVAAMLLNCDLEEKHLAEAVSKKRERIKELKALAEKGKLTDEHVEQELARKGDFHEDFG